MNAQTQTLPGACLRERGVYPELDHHVPLLHRAERRAVMESASWAPSYQIVHAGWYIHSTVYPNGYIGHIASPDFTSSGGCEVVAQPSFGSFTTLRAAAAAERDYAIECWRAFDSGKAA